MARPEQPFVVCTFYNAFIIRTEGEKKSKSMTQPWPQVLNLKGLVEAVPLFSEARGFGISRLFSIFQELKIESTSAITLGPQKCLPGFPLGLEGLIQSKGLGTLQ